ncbi:PEP-CTERM sorting domain-containing protein [Planctomycetes bacterium K23_9]|uniref:PEP-CTERM protein-sorting domain-containing protein n=1 Tax=Stieleria marina TaxID=1930275 RepID=A0A517NNW6_9BACT|nr:hypothetical protein K239x_07450 [Planctomycetes bacterium K23_9]
MGHRIIGALAAFFVASAFAFAAPVNIVANILDGGGEGFNDATLGAARTGALQFALDIWGNALEASYVGETVTIDVQFNPLGGGANSATLGFAGALGSGFVAGNPQGNNVFFAGGIRNHLSGADVVAGSEMQGFFNSDVDGNTVLGNTTFYYGTDGMGGANTVDFVEVALHEIGHGLGFGGTIAPFDAVGVEITDQNNINDGTQVPTTARYINGGLFNSFDNQVVRKSDSAALTGLTDAERMTAILNDDIRWNGASGVTADLEGTYSTDFGGTPAGNWRLGSTYSHVDEDDFPLELMSPIATVGTGFEIDPITRGMMSDVGWTVTAVPEPSTVFAIILLGGVSFTRRRRN